MLVFRTDIVKQFRFPSFPGEKFIPEAFMYDQYDECGVLHICREALYICEYMQDGLTASMRKVIHDNPKGYELFIKNRMRKDKRLRFLVPDIIRYIAIKLVLKDGRIFADCTNRFITFILYFPGLLFYKKAYSQFDR